MHDYLLIEFEKENVSITKSNGNMFCKHVIDQDSESNGKILVEEKRLSALVNNAKGEFITFKVSGKKTIIKDDINEVKLEAINDVNVEAFQKFPDTQGTDRTILNPEMLSALFEAKNFASIVESNLHYIYTHELKGSHYVFATNRYLMYQRKFNEPLPQLALSADVCTIISTFQHVEYFTAGNYDFFDTGKTVYGFIKTEYRQPEYMNIINSLSESENFRLVKEEILSFCELVNSLAISKFPLLIFDDADEKIVVHFDENEYNAESEKALDVQKNFSPKSFAMNCAYLTQALKCFTSDEIVFTPGENERIYGLTHPEEKGLLVMVCPVQVNK
jgi:DNA polymerase III sliding clamp (beta) subunit (PCNA family)